MGYFRYKRICVFYTYQSGKKGEASKSISARGAKSGASKSASGAKGGASKSVSASGAKSVSAKRGAASGAKVTKRGAAKSNSAHSSMNTKVAKMRKQQDRPATISELQALEEAYVQHNADRPSVSHGSVSL
ncbi:hypothetical protein Tco_0137501 [Tanacetum coccineum]